MAPYNIRIKIISLVSLFSFIYNKTRKLNYNKTYMIIFVHILFNI